MESTDLFGTNAHTNLLFETCSAHLRSSLQAGSMPQRVEGTANPHRRVSAQCLWHAASPSNGTNAGMPVPHMLGVRSMSRSIERKHPKRRAHAMTCQMWARGRPPHRGVSNGGAMTRESATKDNQTHVCHSRGSLAGHRCAKIFPRAGLYGYGTRIYFLDSKLMGSPRGLPATFISVFSAVGYLSLIHI